MILVALLIFAVGIIAGLNHCAYRLGKLTDKPVRRSTAVTDYKPEPVRTYAMK